MEGETMICTVVFTVLWGLYTCEEYRDINMYTQHCLEQKIDDVMARYPEVLTFNNQTCSKTTGTKTFTIESHRWPLSDSMKRQTIIDIRRKTNET
jgi:hypothetical protein